MTAMFDWGKGANAPWGAASLMLLLLAACDKTADPSPGTDMGTDMGGPADGVTPTTTPNSDGNPDGSDGQQPGSDPTATPASDGSDPNPGAPSAGTEPLSPTAHLTRASMALRGLRPTLAELQAVADDPRQLSAIVDYYLTTSEFGTTVREMYAEALLTDIDAVLYPAGFVPRGDFADMDSQQFNGYLKEAPLRLIEHVVMNDRPLSEIVTADYALANDVVSTVWGMTARDPSETPLGDGYRTATFDDGRPTAGLLSDPFLFTRHSSTASNKGRGRANQISRALLCYDFLEREIALDSRIDLADPASVNNAVTNNPACVSCHQTLDPLSAYFAAYRPIYVPTEEPRYPVPFVRPLYTAILRVTAPAYFGLVGGDVSTLGTMVAMDPRFTSCAARRFYSYLAQVEPGGVPEGLLDTLQGVLLDNELSGKALAKAIVLSDAFAASHASAPSDDEAGQDQAGQDQAGQDQAGQDATVDVDALVGFKKARPRQLARSIEALTGYRWRTRLPVDIGTGTIGTIDLLDDGLFGFKVLAGGTDGQFVTRPSHTMTATAALTVENLADRAATHVVAKDYLIEDPKRRWLLTEVEADTLDETRIRAQLAKLDALLFGELSEPDSESVDAAYALFSGALSAAEGDSRRAWTVTLFAMFQDPRFLHF